MTLKTQIDDDVAAVFLDTDDFAADVTRYPDNDTDNPVTVTGVFRPAEPQLDYDRGKGVLHRAEFDVDADETLLETDTWLIDTEKWATERIGKIEGGMRTVHLVRREQEYTQSNSTNNTGR